MSTKIKNSKRFFIVFMFFKLLCSKKENLGPNDSIESITFMKEVLQICPELLFDNLDKAHPSQYVPL
jgi:hypothetical protein